MKISEAVKILGDIQKDRGDIRLYLEVGEDAPCKSCGEEKYKKYDGFCSIITTINIDNEVAVWLLAMQDE